MNFPYYIAKRYLVTKKSINVIHIISLISLIGVATGTLALIVVLSVFNGFDNLITSLFNSFDPDLKIILKEGKTFNPTSDPFSKIKKMEGILHYTEVIEETALVEYNTKQYIATIKGVSQDFEKMTGMDSMIVQGKFILKDNQSDYAVLGYGVAYYLSVGLNFVNPLRIWVPRRTDKISFDPQKAFNRKSIFPSGIFSIQMDIDSKYILVPISFARELMDYSDEVTAVEIQIDKQTDVQKLQEKIKQLLGEKFEVKNRFEQREMLFRIMKSEKWMIYFILSFIIIIASFNMIGSLTMLILDKKRDISILQGLGAPVETIRKIFLLEGWLISSTGALIGLFLGAVLCWLQQEFGLLKLHGSGSFIIDYYPVQMKFMDFVLVLLTVLCIGFVTSWIPVRYITKKFLPNKRFEA